MSQPYMSLEAQLHDAFWEAEDDGSEVALMAAFMKRHPGSALEMGAGSGRLLFPLVEMGFAIEGIELSTDMLDLGVARAECMGIHPPLHHGDMSTWDDGRKFSSILAPAFTLQLSNNLAATLRHWHGLLKENGGLYLTMFMPYAELLGDLPENEWYDDHQVTLADGRFGLLKTRHRLDHEKQIVEREHHYSLSGDSPVSFVSKQQIRWIEHSQITQLLAECGFRVDRFFVDFDPERRVADPDEIDFDGILTYYAAKIFPT